MLAAALAALLLALGLAACGGGDSSSSTAADTGGKSQSASSSNGSTSKQGGTSGTDEDKSGSDGGGQQPGGNASDFEPKPHNDSGGGSEQFKVKGGDNSVQEFGDEADTSDFDDAAVALHNFLDARADGNWAAACEYMDKSVIESFEKLIEQAKPNAKTMSCGVLLEGLTNPAANPSLKQEAAQADVGSLRIEDEQAFLIYTGIKGTVLAIPMSHEGGVWKVSSLSGTPIS